MKAIITTVALLFGFSMTAQESTHSWTFDGSTREYIQYVPASYDGTTPVPVVFCLHGLGDNMNNFKGIGMNFVADTANFIVITPQALVDPLVSSSAWNSGASYLGYTLNGGIDDVGFLGAVLDTLIANYNIDQQRVYSCGFSMGGFMTNKLGCEMNDRIAAIASVAGTIGGAVNCQPGRAIPACHFHGTGDSTVLYANNEYGNDAEDLALYWAGNNNCNLTPTVTNLPDIQADGFTITHKLFSSCDDGAEVELFRVDSAGHIWLTPANDIFYTTEIWKFFNKHTHSENVSVMEQEVLFNMYPNPANDIVYFEFLNEKVSQIQIIDQQGRVVVSENRMAASINVANLSTGNYLVRILTNDGEVNIQKLNILH